MSDKLLTDLTVTEFENIVHKKMRDIPADYFLEAVEKRIVSLGKELTGKDINNNNDVLDIRKTFDASYACRQAKESVKNTFITSTAKNAINWILTLVLLGWVAYLSKGP